MLRKSLETGSCLALAETLTPLSRPVSMLVSRLPRVLPVAMHSSSFLPRTSGVFDTYCTYCWALVVSVGFIPASANRVKSDKVIVFVDVIDSVGLRPSSYLSRGNVEMRRPGPYGTTVGNYDVERELHTLQQHAVGLARWR